MVLGAVVLGAMLQLPSVSQSHQPRGLAARVARGWAAPGGWYRPHCPAGNTAEMRRSEKPFLFALPQFLCRKLELPRSD